MDPPSSLALRCEILPVCAAQGKGDQRGVECPELPTLRNVEDGDEDGSRGAGRRQSHPRCGSKPPTLRLRGDKEELRGGGSISCGETWDGA